MNNENALEKSEYPVDLNPSFNLDELIIYRDNNHIRLLYLNIQSINEIIDLNINNDQLFKKAYEIKENANKLLKTGVINYLADFIKVVQGSNHKASKKLAIQLINTQNLLIEDRLFRFINSIIDYASSLK